MHYVALQKQTLSRFSHHWFWGLCVDKNQNHSLLDSALYLQLNPARREILESRVEVINQQYWPIRWVYWLFNVQQYRLRYYQLQGYWSLRLFEKGAPMFSENDHSAVKMAGVFIVTTASMLAIKTIPSRMKESLQWFSSKIRPFIANQNIRSVPESPESPESIEPIAIESTELISLALSQRNPQPVTSNDVGAAHFTVEPKMIAPLRTLGLPINVGDHLTLDALKLAYNKARLQTHPDKLRTEEHTAFVEVINAYETLLSLIQEQLIGLSHATSDSFQCGDVDSVRQQIASMREENETMFKEIRIMRQENEQMKIDAEQSRLELEQLAERRERQHVRELEQCDRIMALNERVSKQNEQIKDLHARFIRLIELKRAQQEGKAQLTQAQSGSFNPCYEEDGIPSTCSTSFH